MTTDADQLAAALKIARDPRRLDPFAPALDDAQMLADAVVETAFDMGNAGGLETLDAAKRRIDVLMPPVIRLLRAALERERG